MEKTLLITGTGSVSNSWEPVKIALKKYYGESGIMLPGRKEDLNFVLADMIHRLRWTYKLFKNGEAAPFISEYLEVKEKIIKELRKSEEINSICLRPEINKIREKFFTDKVWIMTANWDSQSKRFAEQNSYEHLFFHGYYDEGCLFLPSEATEDDYLKCLRINQYGLYKKAIEKIFSTFENLKDLHTLILWGISLSALDVELGMVIGARLSTEKLKRIVIVDKSPKVVYQRLRFLLREKWKGLESKVDLKLIRPTAL